MRILTALLGMLLIAACAGDDTERHPATTTTSPVGVTARTSESDSTSTTARATTTSGTAGDTDDAGGESIGVTDRVTIVITDPEDG